MKEYYFDNSATSSPKPEEVYRSVDRALRELNANPGRGSYRKSLEIAREIYGVREKLAKFFNIEDPLQIAFTSNATMGLNMAIKGAIPHGCHVITSLGEHNSVIRPLNSLDVEIEYVEDEEFEDRIGKNTRAVVINHVSNVTGKVMDIKRIGEICRRHNLLFIVDVSQSAGIFKIDVEEMGIDILCFTGHKSLFGIQGTGGIYVRPGVEITPLLEGGTGTNSKYPHQPKEMPELLEAGTLDTPGILSLGAGIDFINSIGLENIKSHEMELTKRFIEGLKRMEGITIYGDLDEERGPVVSLNIEGADPGDVAMVLDEEFGIMVRSGFHCAPLMHEKLGTQEQGAIRFSFGYFNSESEIDYALESLQKIVKNFI